jgi:hypothetical protein
VLRELQGNECDGGDNGHKEEKVCWILHVTLKVVRGMDNRAAQTGMLVDVEKIRVVIHGHVLPGTAPLVVGSDGMVGGRDS